MNGQAGGSTLGNTFGQGTSWVPLGLAALGGGLAGAGRAGSPASNMGSGLMSSMLGYYANQAATADERARRMKIEDEALQRQKAMDEQNRQVQFGNLAIQSGHGISMQAAPGAIESNIGGQKVWFTPPAPYPIKAFRGAIDSAYGPDEASKFDQSTAGLSAKDLATIAPILMQSAGVSHGKTQTQNLSNTIGALGRETPKVTPEMELGMGSPPPMNPPPFTQAQVAMYQQAAQFPESRNEALKQINTHLRRVSPQTGSQQGPGPVRPGFSRSEQYIQDENTGQWSQRVTDTPEHPTVKSAAETAAFAKVEAARYDASPRFKKFFDSLNDRGQEAITTSLNKAKSGDIAGITEIQEAMGEKESGDLGPDKQFGNYLEKNPKQREDYFKDKANPEKQRARDREKHYLSRISGLEETLRITQPTHPTYPAIAQQQAENWRNLAEQDPAKWYNEAFSHMAKLLGWTRTKAMEESAAFAKRHKLQIQGVQ